MNAAALEKICGSLKGTTTDVKWGADLCYCIGKKMYCVTGLDAPFRASFKVTPELFGELTEREGIEPAPYVAKHHWVFVTRPSALTSAEWRQYVELSYHLVLEKLPARLKKSLN